MKNFLGAQLCSVITSDASSQPLTTKTIGWGLFSWKKMWSCKWKHRTEWGCLKIIEKTMKTISPAEGWLAAWEKTRQMPPQDTRKCWSFLDYGNAAWIRGHCCRLNQGPRIHTCSLVPITCMNLTGRPQTRPPPERCQQWGSRRLGERQGSVRQRPGGAVRRNKPSSLSCWDGWVSSSG